MDKGVCLMVADADVGKVVHFTAELVHVLFGAEKCFPCVFQLEPDVPCVLGGPAPFRPSQCEVEGVLAGDADGRECCLEGAGAVMGVVEYEIWLDPVAGHLVTLRHFGEYPCFSAFLQHAGGFVADAVPQQFLGKGKCFVVLYDLILVRDDAEYTVVGVADVGEVAGDRYALFGCHGLLVDVPVEAGEGERFAGGLRVPYVCAEAAPCGFSCVKVCVHIGFLL